MKEKEKARELVEKYLDSSLQIEYDEGDSSGMVSISFDVAKQCALIAVDEIISIKLLWWQKDTNELDYWKAVKQEIEKL